MVVFVCLLVFSLHCFEVPGHLQNVLAYLPVITCCLCCRESVGSLNAAM